MKLPGISFGQKERAIMDGILDDFAVVRKAAADFQELVSSAARGDVPAAKQCFSRVLEGEDNADAIHRRLDMEIAEGAFFGGVREDMLNLLERMDDIADSAKGAARFLEAEEALDDFAVALLGSDPMRNFVASLLKTVDSLGVLLVALRTGRKEAMAKIQPVELAEEEADSFKDQLEKILFDPAKRPNPITVIQMRDFLTVADNIADRAEDASDVVLILLAKGYD